MTESLIRMHMHKNTAAHKNTLWFQFHQLKSLFHVTTRIPFLNAGQKKKKLQPKTYDPGRFSRECEYMQMYFCTAELYHRQRRV